MAFDALPSPLLNPLEGPTMQSCEKLGLERRSRLPALKGGKGACQKSRDQIRKMDQKIKLESASKNQPQEGQLAFGNTFGCWDKPRALLHTRLTTARTRGKPPPSPIQYILQLSAEATSKWLFFPGLSSWSPETVSGWSPRTLDAHSSSPQTRIGTRSEPKLQLLPRALRCRVALLEATLGRGRFPTFSGRESN